jgi:glycoside hydrolase-like protein
VADLPGTVRSAPSGAAGFDCDRRLAASDARAAVAAGFTYCIRYVTLARGQDVKGNPDDDLSAAEATTILGAGVALMGVQHAAFGPVTPEKGTRFGDNAVANAREVGFPAGVNIWLDLEEIAASSRTADIIAYCTNWFGEVHAGGYVPGIYVGSNAGLSGDQLFALPFQHYWKSGSTVPSIPRRGYQLLQTIDAPLATIGHGSAIEIDTDRTQTDQLGGNAQWLAPA